MKGIFANISDPDTAAEAALGLYGADAAIAVLIALFKLELTDEMKTTRFGLRLSVV